MHAVISHGKDAGESVSILRAKRYRQKFRISEQILYASRMIAR